MTIAEKGTRRNIMIKKAEFQSFNSHDCETFYKCPYCGKVFGDWSLYHQKHDMKTEKDYCPYCKEEIEV